MERPRGRAAAWWLVPSSLARKSVDSFRRVRQSPSSVVRVVLIHVLLDAFLTLPLAVSRLMDAIVYDRSNGDATGIIYIRLLAILLICCKLAVGCSLYLDLSGCHAGWRYIFFASFDEQQELRQLQLWVGTICVLPAGVLLLLNVIDIWLSSHSPATRPMNRVLLALLYVMVPLNIASWACSTAVLRGIQERNSQLRNNRAATNPQGMLARMRESNFNLSTCSRTLDKDLVEHCCICLDGLHQGHVAATLPCGHTFHTACLEPWLQHGGCCPMRCEAKKSHPDEHPSRPWISWWRTSGVGLGAGGALVRQGQPPLQQPPHDLPAENVEAETAAHVVVTVDVPHEASWSLAEFDPHEGTALRIPPCRPTMMSSSEILPS